MDRDRLLKIKTRIDNIELAIDEIVEHGVSYSLQGSHAVTRMNLADLVKMKKTLLLEANSILYPNTDRSGLVKVVFS